MNGLKKNILNIKVTKEPEAKKRGEKVEQKKTNDNLKRPLNKVLVTSKQLGAANGTVTVKQNYKSTPTVLNKANDLVKLDKEKYSSQKNEGKLLKSDIQYFSNDHKKNPINLHSTTLKKTGVKVEKNHALLNKEEENLTERDRNDIVNKLLKKSDGFANKNIKPIKKTDSNSNQNKNTNILTTNCTDNGKDSMSLNYGTQFDHKEETGVTNEEAKQSAQIIDLKSNFDGHRSTRKLVLTSSETLESDILESIQKFGCLLRFGAGPTKADENHPDIVKLLGLLHGLKTNSNEISHHMINENNTIKRDTFINEHCNKKQREQSLYNTIKRESIINGIYLNSDMRIKKYGIYFDFFNDNILQITNFLKQPECPAPQLSPTSTLRIIEKTISNYETNKPTSNLISDISMFTESEKNGDNKNSLKKHSPNGHRDNTFADYNCSDMQENAVVNKPMDISSAKINIGSEIEGSQQEDNPTKFKAHGLEEKNSLVDLLDNRSINSEAFKGGAVDDEHIMRNLEFDMMSNMSSVKNVSKYFHMDSVRTIANDDCKDPNVTIQFNNFSGKTNLQERREADAKKRIPMRINNIKSKLNLDQTNKIEDFNNQRDSAVNNADETIIHNQFDKPAKEHMIHYIKTEKAQKYIKLELESSFTQ